MVCCLSAEVQSLTLEKRKLELELKNLKKEKKETGNKNVSLENRLLACQKQKESLAKVVERLQCNQGLDLAELNLVQKQQENCEKQLELQRIEHSALLEIAEKESFEAKSNLEQKTVEFCRFI